MRHFVGGSWSQTDILDQHDLRVNDIDWAPNTNRLKEFSVNPIGLGFWKLKEVLYLLKPFVLLIIVNKIIL